MDINRIGSLASQMQNLPVGGVKPAGLTPTDLVPRTGESGKSFGQTLTDLVKEVDQAQSRADAAVQDLAAGKTDSLHEVMLAMGKAELSFKFLMQTRNKLVDAYNEIIRMQV